MADTLLGGIVINEILVDPNGATNFDTDGTAPATDEYVEFFNTSSSAIDISGLELWDAGGGNWFTFPPGTILQPGGHALVLSGVQSGGALPTGGANDLFFDAGRGTALINNGADNVTLYDPTNDEFVRATFNGDTLDDPTLGGGYTGFSDTDVTYYHIMFAHHQVVFAETLPTESLYLGKEAVKPIPTEALCEIETLLDLPLSKLRAMGGPPPARPLIVGKRAVRLLDRHHCNAQPFALTSDIAA